MGEKEYDWLSNFDCGFKSAQYFKVLPSTVESMKYRLTTLSYDLHRVERANIVS